MGRVRAKTKKGVATPSAANGKEEPTEAALLEKARTLVVQCNYDLAKKFAARLLERDPKHVDGKELLGIIQIELGELDEAKSVSLHGSPGTLQSLTQFSTDIPIVASARRPDSSTAVGAPVLGAIGRRRSDSSPQALRGGRRHLTWSAKGQG